MTGEKLREITDEAKAYAVGNKALAALVVHTPTGELLRQISSWLADNFDFLSVTSEEGPTGQIELLSTAITDGWMAGLGVAMPPSTDALGQLLGEYAKRVYNSQLQHLKVCICDHCLCLLFSISWISVVVVFFFVIVGWATYSSEEAQSKSLLLKSFG